MIIKNIDDNLFPKIIKIKQEFDSNKVEDIGLVIGIIFPY